MAITFPELPYPKNALEPHISARTLEFHHGKHHKSYVDKGNDAIKGTEYENMSLEEVIKKTSGDSSKTAVFNNCAQAWNHAFYWKCLKGDGGGRPTGKIAEKIDADFGSYDKFAEEFKAAGAGQFGSGWAWLALDGDRLKVVKTLNAENPMTQGMKPLLTADVWEHAYYLDYQNRRPDYLSAFLDKLVNWDFVNENLG